MHVLLTVAMSWFGWAWLDGIPVALTLSQLPAAVWLLAWAAEHADRIPLPARRQTVLASPATQAVESAEQILLAAAAGLEAHREGRHTA